MKTQTETEVRFVDRGALKLRPAAKYLSISEITLRRLVARGVIRPNRATRHLLFGREELDRFANS
jgi:excisionase family DNA binding protein